MNAVTGPITPKEAADAAHENFPSFVFEVFNGLIKKNLRNGRAVVYHDAVVESLIPYTTNESTRSEIFDNNWLDVEGAYQKAGWKVVYDTPCSWGGDAYAAHFIFSK